LRRRIAQWALSPWPSDRLFCSMPRPPPPPPLFPYTTLFRSPRSPVGYLERAYLSRVRRYLETGRTPMRCHALSASCFVDSWGNVFPCTIYDRRIGSLRDVDYDLARLWSTPEADRLEREIFDYRCPQCWTP